MILNIEVNCEDTVTLLNAMHKIQESLKRGIFVGSGHVYDNHDYYFEYQLEMKDFVDRYEVRLNGNEQKDDLTIECDNFKDCRLALRERFYTDENFKHEAYQKWYNWSVWKNGVDVSREYANWLRAQI